MLSLVHQNPQLLFFRAAPIYSVPRRCCFMGYSISEGCIYIYFCRVLVRSREESNPLIVEVLLYGRPFLQHFNYSPQCRGICRFDEHAITPAVADCFWLCFLFTFGFMPSSCALWNLHFSWCQSSCQVHMLHAIWPFLSYIHFPQLQKIVLP